MNVSTSTSNAATRDEHSAWFVQALRGDSDAATRLYEACVPSLAAKLRRWVGENIAEECAHEAMVSAFRQGQRFQAGRSFDVWLRTIAWRLALNEIRNGNRRRTREQAYEAQNRLQAASEPASGRSLLTALKHSVSALPPEQQDLLQRRFHLDHSPDEIAASLGRTRVAVSVSLHRICKRLRSDLEQHVSF